MQSQEKHNLFEFVNTVIYDSGSLCAIINQHRLTIIILILHLGVCVKNSEGEFKMVTLSF